MNVAILSNAQTPYRLHLHLRLARELPDVQIWSVFTHDKSNAPWSMKYPSEIRPMFFGTGEDSAGQDHLTRQLHEWRKGGRIVSWIQKQDINCVVVLGYNDLGRMRVLQRCYALGIPAFLFGDSNVLGDHANGVKRWLKRRLVTWAIRKSSGILHCGSLGAAYFGKYGATADKVFPFPYEPDYQLIEDLLEDEVEKVRKELGVRKQRRYLLFSGRLAPEKRVDLLLSAFSSIATQRPLWDLLIVGDGPLRPILRASVPANLQDRIIWVGFVDDPRKMGAVYKCADVLVLPSDFEPWGIVVTEAATCLALLCSDIVGAAADLIRPGVNGLLFRTGDETSLRERLLDVTEAGRTDIMKAASPAILAEWRRRSDPVLGLKAALHSVGYTSRTPSAVGRRSL